MPKSKDPEDPGITLPTNNTVKIPDELRSRIAKAMVASGFTVWSEFCRVALTEKCRAIEQQEQKRGKPS
jgi:hypothetical protein